MHLPWSHKASLLTEFSWRLKVSGYSQGFRSKIISEGITGYLNTLIKRVKEDIPFNRSRELIRSQSKKRRVTSRNWFNSGDSTYSSVLYVPATPNSTLAKMLQKHEMDNNQGRNFRVKIVEKAGRSLKSILAPNYPWSFSKCEDLDCFPCSSSTGKIKVHCRTPGVVYNIICNLCHGMAIYYGESGKNCYSRGKKHLEDYKAGNSSHCMSIHMKIHHPQEPWLVSNFKMIPVKSVRKPLDRQVSEALEIYNSEAEILMNSGAEWRAGQVPRAAVARPRPA